MWEEEEEDGSGRPRAFGVPTVERYPKKNLEIAGNFGSWQSPDSVKSVHDDYVRILPLSKSNKVVQQPVAIIWHEANEAKQRADHRNNTREVVRLVLEW
jgi:hypothetical protein